MHYQLASSLLRIPKEGLPEAALKVYCVFSMDVLCIMSPIVINHLVYDMTEMHYAHIPHTQGTLYCNGGI